MKQTKNKNYRKKNNTTRKKIQKGGGITYSEISNIETQNEKGCGRHALNNLFLKEKKIFEDKSQDYFETNEEKEIHINEYHKYGFLFLH